MAVNVKLGVDLSEFTSGIKQGQAEMKTLKAEMKATEAEFKATGNAEKAMADKTKTLTQQLKTQKSIMEQADKALQEMTKAGIKPTDAAYQKMYVQMLNAKAGMNETQAALNGLSGAQQEAAAGADNLASSVNGIGKKMSLDQVISGVDTIKRGLEGAAQTAAQLGRAIWDNIMDSARLADDTGTAAQLLDMDVEEYQKYKGVFDTVAELTVADWQRAKRKVQQAIYDPSSDQVDVMAALGISPMEQVGTGKYGAVEVAKDWETVFWEAGAELQRRVKNGSMSQDQADVYANALFGKGYASLGVLLDMGREEFENALEQQNVASKEAVEKDAALNDAVIKLTNSYEALKLEVTSGLAPALTDAATALDGLLGKLLEYLKTEEGQQMLEDLGTAVSGLFEDLGKIEPDKVVEGFVGVFNGIKDTLQWLVDNKSTVEGLLIGIAGAWGTAKLAGGALDILNLINGIKGLSNAGAVSAAASAGTSVGASWGAAFASAVLKAAPWLLFVYGILKPADTADSSDLTQEQEAQDKEENWLLYATETTVGKLHSKRQNFLKWFNNLEDTETESEMLDEPMLSLTERQRKAVEDYWDAFRSGNPMSEAFAYQDLFDVFEGVDGGMETLGQITSLIDSLKDLKQEDLPEWWFGEGEGLPLEVTPEIDVEAAQEQLNNTTLKVKVAPTFLDVDPSQHANGLPYVPYDGYLASLHKGEQVLSAREVASRNYSSNLYVESMYMNNGADADGLAARMAAAQRRTISGYGG